MNFTDICIFHAVVAEGDGFQDNVVFEIWLL